MKEENQDLIIDILYDPSDNNFISYKSFITYLTLRQLFIQVYDYEKQIPYGYVVLPLSKFLRNDDSKVLTQKIELILYDNYSHEEKGNLGLNIQSEEVNTAGYFNLIEHNTMLNLVEAINSNIDNIKHKKIVSRGSANKDYNNIKTFQNEEEKNNYKNIEKIYLNIVNNKTQIKVGNLYNNRASEIRDIFIKEKETKLRKEILDFNFKAKEINISLIQGEPHYFNFVINNNSNSEQKFLVNISTDDNKYYNNYKSDCLLSLVTNSEENEYATMINNLIIPDNYHFISKDGFFILGPQKSVPLLFKCLSYKCFNGLEKDFQYINTIIIYDIKGIAKYFLKVKIFKVFPVIDFEYHYRKPIGKNQNIKFNNPYKNISVIKSKQVLNNYIFLNGVNNDNYIPEIKIDEKNNDFYYLFNDSLDFSDNISNFFHNNEKEKEFRSNNAINIYKNKKLIFLYKDQFRIQLLCTYRFIINSYEYLNIKYNFGEKERHTLSFNYTGKENIKIKFFSSDNNVLYFEDSLNEGLLLESNKSYKINYFFYPKKILNYEISLIAIDIKRKEMFKTWIVSAQIEKSNIIKIININYLINIYNDMKTQFEFTNPMNQKTSLNFICSTDTVIEIPINQYIFRPYETKQFILNIKKILIAQKVKAYIFINDENNLLHQVIEIEINYKLNNI